MAKARLTKGPGPAGRPRDPGRPASVLGRRESAVPLAATCLWSALALWACTGQIGPKAGAGSGNSTGATGASSGSGAGPGAAGSVSVSGAGGSATGTAGTAGASTGTGGSTTVVQCNGVNPGRAPLRRLTTYEYNNTIHDLLGDTTNPGSALPPQVDSAQNLFGNDADLQAPSSLLIEKYQTVAASVAARATANSTALAMLASCATTVTTSTEESCARTIATSLAPRAYRRTVASTEIDEFVALYKSVRALSSTVTFASGVAAMIEAMLQAPEFLYRVEYGTTVSGNTAVKRVAGREIATRLSYMFWQTMPDAPLFQAADAGMLDTNDGVLAQAKKMLDDQRSRPMVSFFFDNLLPIPDLAGLTRSPTLFPTWASSVGVDMRSEVQRVLQYEIFENTSQSAPPYAAGSWPAVLTAPYTFVNQNLFKFYGPSAFASGTTVTGTALTKVSLNPDQRLGLLTLGGIMAGLTTTDLTNEVLRGSFIINKLMCRGLTVPAGLNPVAPDPYSGKTARERFGFHSAMPQCAVCHKIIDPLGLPFENYDAVGLYRTTEHWTDPNTQISYDTPIDASGAVTGVDGTAANGIELVKLLAMSPDIGPCFASHWIRFTYGRSLDQTTDACNQQSVDMAFASNGYNIKQLLLAITQSDGFLYRPAQ
jgi:hypothetical protein